MKKDSTPITKALRQLNNAGANLFDAAEMPNRTVGNREKMLAGRQVALSLAHLLEYGVAYLPAFTGNVEALVKTVSK